LFHTASGINIWSENQNADPVVGVDGARIKYTYPSADHVAMMMKMVMKLLLHDVQTLPPCVTEVKPVKIHSERPGHLKYPESMPSSISHQALIPLTYRY